jgi:hypothetical protein
MAGEVRNSGQGGSSLMKMVERNFVSYFSATFAKFWLTKAQ